MLFIAALVPSFKIVRSFYFVTKSDRLSGDERRNSPKEKETDVGWITFSAKAIAERLLVLLSLFCSGGFT